MAAKGTPTPLTPSYQSGAGRQTATFRHATDNIDRLISELRQRGIAFLTGGSDPTLAASVARHPLPAQDLLRQLAACPEPSVRDATVALLLLHPALAEAIPAEIPPMEAEQDDALESLAVLGLAALYLQRLWRTRLRLALRADIALPSRFWRERGLPDPDDSTLDEPAELGLRALAIRERRRLGRPLHYLAMWQQQVDHLVSQAWRARRRAAPEGAAIPADAAASPREGAPESAKASVRAGQTTLAALPGWLGMPHAPRGGTSMSMRAPADRERIELFLQRLGSLTRASGRIYLVGGTTMVYEGFRATTVDVDVFVEADDPGPLIATIRGLKDALDLNVEFASPRDFIPLPAGWRERSVYVGRYGPLDVFHFDLYSMALSKIERGTERDFADVAALVRNGRVDLERLDAMFAEILPRITTEGLAGMDPAVFAEHYRYLRALLAGQT